MRIWLWLQRPPRVQWVLKVIHDTPEGTAIVRTWFEDYGPGAPPPPYVTVPVALACAGIARAAIAGADAATKYQVELRS
jgi:hypothetical protein